MPRVTRNAFATLIAPNSTAASVRFGNYCNAHAPPDVRIFDLLPRESPFLRASVPPCSEPPLSPSSPSSPSSPLANLTRGEAFNETFERAVFRFTDDTADRIKKGGEAATGPNSQASDLLKETNQALRFRLRDNVHARILQDVLSTQPGGLFQAFIVGRKYSDKLVYTVDPHGAGAVAPEEVQLLSWANGKEGTFAAHHFSDFYRQRQRVSATPGSWVDIEHQKLVTEIEGSARSAATRRRRSHL